MALQKIRVIKPTNIRGKSTPVGICEVDEVDARILFNLGKAVPVQEDRHEGGKGKGKGNPEDGK